MKIKGKILIYILSVSIALFLVSIGFLSFNFRRLSKENAQRIVEKEAYIHANSFKASLDTDLALTRALAICFQSYHLFPRTQRSFILNSIQQNVLKSNPQILTVGTSWEYKKFDSAYFNSSGRFLEGYHRQGGKIKSIKRNYLEDTTSIYFKLKESKAELFSPYQENYSGREGDDVLVASIASPVIINNEFHGLAGIDVALERFERLIKKVSPLPRSFAFLLSNNSQFIAHPDTAMTFKYIHDYVKSFDLSVEIKDKVAKGEGFSLDLVAEIDGREEKMFAYIAPVHLSKIEKPWAIGVVAPYSEVYYEADYNFIISLIIGVICLIILSISTWFFAKRIIDPLKDTSDVVKELATGEIDSIRKLEVYTSDEIGQIRKSVNILVEALRRTAKFALEIGQGNFEVDYARLGPNDVLGNALLAMRKNLKDSEEEDNLRVIEELKLNWSTEGLALFADILRDNQGDMKELAYEIISSLVKHIKAVQGGFYFTQPGSINQDKVELLAFYAFSEKQVNRTSFEIEEGIIGEVVRKNEKVLLDNVPNSYIEVESGLGRANPRKFLVVPISNDNGIYGALEISSFKVFENHQVEFIEKLATNLASTLEAMLANQRTQKLLDETDQQKDQLEQTEHYLKENLQKMEEVQRSTMKREAELKSVLSALHAISPIAEYDMSGTIISANGVLLDLLEMSEEEVIGRKQGSFQTSKSKQEFNEFWEDLRRGRKREEIQNIKIGEKEIWLQEVYSPILDETGKPYKVLNITRDITARKLLEKKLEQRKGKP